MAALTDRRAVGNGWKEYFRQLRDRGEPGSMGKIPVDKRSGFMMDIFGLSHALAGICQYAAGAQKTAGQGTGFLKLLQNTADTEEISKTDVYESYLKYKYGNVMVQDVGRDQESIDRLGANTSGTGNVVIAPNILRQMAENPQKAAYYEKQIQSYFDSLPLCKAQLSMMGHEIHSSGIVIHSDGTVTTYVSGDLKPEVRARIEAQMKAEAEEKAERERAYQARREEAVYAYRKRLSGNVAVLFKNEWEQNEF